MPFNWGSYIALVYLNYHLIARLLSLQNFDETKVLIKTKKYTREYDSWFEQNYYGDLSKAHFSDESIKNDIDGHL